MLTAFQHLSQRIQMFNWFMCIMTALGACKPHADGYSGLLLYSADSLSPDGGGDPCFTVSRQHPPPPGSDDG